MYKCLRKALKYRIFYNSFLVIGLVGCKSHRISEGEKVDIPKFTEVITLKREKDSLGIYNIENGDISKAMETKDMVDVKYNNKIALMFL